MISFAVRLSSRPKLSHLYKIYVNLLFIHFHLDPLTTDIPADWTVVLGDHNRKDENDKFEQRRKVVNITIHEKYVSMYFEGIHDTPPVNDIGK